MNLCLMIFLGVLLAGCPLYIGQSPQDVPETVSSGTFPNLIENGDFESYSPSAKKDIWSVEPEAFFLWDLFSIPGGRRSLFIGASMIAPLEQARLACRLKAVKPQTAYLFEGSFIRNRNIDGVYPTVSLFGRDRRLSDFWASGRWQKISFVFPPSAAPSKGVNAPSEFLEIKVPRADYVLWLDDLSLREIKAVPLSPPDGRRIHRESIAFAWATTPTDRLLDVVLALSRDEDGKGGNVLKFPTNNAGDGPTSTLLIPNQLDRGKWLWRLEVYQYKKLLAVSDTRHFFNEKRPQEISSLSSLASRRRDLTEEKEIRNLELFPIGMLSVPKEDFKELNEIGFNSVSCFSSGQDFPLLALAAARANNLKLLASPSVVLPAQPSSPSFLRPASPRPDMQPFSSDTVLAWLLEDEPEGRSISPKAVFNRRAALLEQGFLQPGAIFLNRSWRTEDYAASTEIIMADPYPVPFEPLSWLSSSLDEVRAVVSGDPAKKTWAVIQAFGWNYGSDEVRATGQGRDPTGQEVRALTYLALAHRAQGLFYYVYRTGDYFIKEKADLWQGLKTTVAEIKHIMPLILAPAATLGYKSESDRSDAWGIPAVHSILKELGPGPGKVQSGFGPSPGFYLISINILNEPVRAAFEFERPPSAAAFDVFSGEGFPLSDSRLVLEFRPLERKVLYFNPAL